MKKKHAQMHASRLAAARPGLTRREAWHFGRPKNRSERGTLLADDVADFPSEQVRV